MAAYVTVNILALLLAKQNQSLQLEAQSFFTLQHLIFQHTESVLWYTMLACNNLPYSINLPIKKDVRIKRDRDKSRIKKSPYFCYIDLVCLKN